MQKIICFLFLLALTSCTKDFTNVKVYGKITDEENIPIDSVIIEIKNAYYGNSPDQSYSVYENYKIKTDSTGFYSIELKKSALIQVLASKEYYKPEFLSKEVFSNNVKINFTLEKP